MHSVWKKTIGIALSLVLCLGLLPTFTVAEGNEAAPMNARDLEHPYWLYGEITNWEPAYFTYNEALGLWQYTHPIEVPEGMYSFVRTEFEVRTDGEEGGMYYGADAEKVRSMGEYYYVFDCDTNIPLVYNDTYNGTENAKRTVLVASHPGAYTFSLNAADMTLSVEYQYEDVENAPYVYILGFQDQDEIPYPMGDVLMAIQFSAGSDFWEVPTLAEVPTDRLDEGETILWFTKEIWGSDEPWEQWFYVACSGKTYAKNNPVVRSVPETGVTLQLEESDDVCRLVCELPSDVQGIYDCYYGEQSHKLVVKRRVVHLDVSAQYLDLRTAPPQPGISTDGTILSGDEVTVTAEYVQGYQFLGWFGDDYSEDEQTGEVYGQVSSAFAYTFHPKKDTVLHALYRPLSEDGSLPITEDYFPDPLFRGYVLREFDTNGNLYLDADEIAAVRYIDVYGTNGEPEPQVAAGTRNGLQPRDADVWSVIGNICGSNWDADKPMTEVRDNIWQSGPLELHAGEQFKVRKNHDWSNGNYGIDSDHWSGSVWVPCCYNGQNLTVPDDDTYTVTLYLGDTVYITLTDSTGKLVAPQGGSGDVWSVIGSICNTNWDADFDMAETAPGEWSSDPLILHKDDELKVRFNHNWDMNYGVAGDWDHNSPIKCWEGGENFVIPYDDTYVVTLYTGNPAHLMLVDSNGQQAVPGGAPISEFVGSLKGIEYFQNLEELYCDPFTFGNDGLLTNVDLSYNPKLKVVDLGCNKLETLDVSMLPELEELSVGYNNLTSIDLSANRKLKKLLADDCKFWVLNLDHNPNLETLDVCGNSNLRTVDISSCPLLVSAWYEGARQPEWLYNINPDVLVFGGTGDHDYRLAVNEGMKIHVVRIDSNSFPDDVFRSYVGDSLDADSDGFLNGSEILNTAAIDVYDGVMFPENYAASVEGIAFFPNLTELHCDSFSFGHDGALTAVDLSHNTKLRIVDLGCNKLEALDVSMLEDLEYLMVGYSYLETLDVTHNLNLKNLICSDSRLSSLDLSQNDRLEQLDPCGNADLTEINLMGCPNLLADYLAGERFIPELFYLDGLHVYGGEGTSYTLAINRWMQIVLPDANNTYVRTLSAACYDPENNRIGGVQIAPDGELYVNNCIELTAPEMPGYRFEGWYRGETQLAETLVCAFTLTENTALQAKYVPIGNAELTVEVKNGAQYTLTGVDGVQNGDTYTVPIGSQVTLTAAEPGKVLYWQNETGKVLGTGASLNLAVVRDMTVTLVYKYETTESASYVQFISDYGQVLKADTYTATTTQNPNDPNPTVTISPEVTFPDPPAKLGCRFIKWVFEGTDTEATRKAIEEKIGAEATITIRPFYERDAATYTVTVKYDGVNCVDDVYGDLHLGDGFTVTAPEIDNLVFNCWKDENNTVLGYAESYFFQITGNRTLTAVYRDAEPDPEPIILLSELSAVELIHGNEIVHRVSASATRNIPDGYTLIEHGVLYARNFDNPMDTTFVCGNENVGKYISSDRSKNGVVKLNIKVYQTVNGQAYPDDDMVVTFRGYMILKNDATGHIETYYTEIRSGSYNHPNN